MHNFKYIPPWEYFYTLLTNVVNILSKEVKVKETKKDKIRKHLNPNEG